MGTIELTDADTKRKVTISTARILWVYEGIDGQGAVRLDNGDDIQSTEPYSVIKDRFSIASFIFPQRKGDDIFSILGI